MAYDICILAFYCISDVTDLERPIAACHAASGETGRQLSPRLALCGRTCQVAEAGPCDEDPVVPQASDRLTPPLPFFAGEIRP
jgi:hypothetical protein